MNPMASLTGLLVTAILFSAPAAPNREEKNMDLGQFSVSLAVKDLQTSKSFYEKLGFKAIEHKEPEGSPPGYDKSWVILKKEEAVIGLFQGMFDKNTLTFNPGDVRSLQRRLKEQGVSFATEADESTKGPAFAFLLDPDGNPVLLDQHGN
jgi:lactoylglutathione lyase